MKKPIKLAAGVCAATLAVTGLLAPGAQASKASISASFSTGGNATAGWLPHHSGFTATLPDEGSYAVITLHHISSTAPAVAPTLVTDNYAAGSPRWYIQFSDGDYLFGYPNGLWDTEGPNVGYHYGVDWATGVGYMGDESVTGAYVVMDASQPVPATDNITSLTYDGFSVGG